MSTFDSSVSVSLAHFTMYGIVHIGCRVGATLSLTGVLVGGIGGFVLATTYDGESRVERKTGLAIGVVLMALGTGLFIAGWFV